MNYLKWFATLIYWIILPIGIGTILLPFTPYFVKKIIYKLNKPLPSFIPFSIIILTLTLLMNWIWGSLFQGHLYHEWDHMFNYYSLINYESPILDGSSSWIAKGWQLWHLYSLWLGITLTIYTIATTFTLWKNKKQKNFPLYQEIIFTSIAIMISISLITIPIFTFLFLLTDSPGISL